jgi:hypothetical protein
VVDEHRVPDAFKNRCVNAARILRSYDGYFIERIALNEGNADSKENTLDVGLHDGPHKPSVVISLASLYSVRPLDPEFDWSFTDEISLTHLPKLPLPWPIEAHGRLERTESVPELAWLRISGPAEVDALAAIVTVY